METQYWHVEADGQAIKQAAKLLKQGEAISFPTETVYGLGADATNEVAVNKIFKAKGRPSDNPLIVHIADRNVLEDLAVEIPAFVWDLLDEFSPGPITYILKNKGVVARNVTAGLETVAIRIPNHPIALELLRESGLPLAAPSANLSGKPSPTTAKHVMDDLVGKIAGVIDGGTSKVGVESTVIDCTGAVPVILRLGAITAADVGRIVGDVRVYKAEDRLNEAPKSPGLKYKHYAPEIPLLLVAGDSSRLQQVINALQADGKRVGLLACTSTASILRAEKTVELGDGLVEIAANLYNALRSFEKGIVDVIVSESFTEVGIGKVIMDRLTRAADDVL